MLTQQKPRTAPSAAEAFWPDATDPSAGTLRTHPSTALVQISRTHLSHTIVISGRRGSASLYSQTILQTSDRHDHPTSAAADHLPRFSGRRVSPRSTGSCQGRSPGRLRRHPRSAAVPFVRRPRLCADHLPARSSRRSAPGRDLRRSAQRYDVLVDLMVNHISRRSPEFQDFLRRGRASPHADLFLTLDKVWPGGEPPPRRRSAHLPPPAHAALLQQ